ncbi:hypothetical protein [Pedobacter hiemivivus]|uniref:Uncharacterized protein n=1 Tax=Pedobacter hiemivivus TaxID=2530454 RepID=A0A4R0NC67_9SPHI|nr:hypothetical protein [Pedobacter hiemivivus]TCC97828.1 hypothetical protein EZ444_07920 [Pedobacter hiemivivus]
MAFNEDTLALYGKINASSKIEEAHTFILSRKKNTELFVTEIFRETSSSRIYAIENNVKSKFIIEIKQYDATTKELSVLDHNWQTGVSKILTSTIISDGIINQVVPKAANVFKCLQPDPHNELNKNIDQTFKYVMCSGLASNNNQGLDDIISAVKKIIDQVKKMEDYKSSLEQLNLAGQAIEQQSLMLKATSSGISKLKYVTEDLNTVLNTLANLKDVLVPRDNREILLYLLNETNALLYYQRMNQFLVIIIQAIDKKTGKPITELMVNMELINPLTGQVLWKAFEPVSKNTGNLTFTFEPPAWENYENIEKLHLNYSFTLNGEKVSYLGIISLQYIIPNKIEIIDGNNQVTVPNKKLTKPLSVKVTEKDGFPARGIKVQWRVKKGGGKLGSIETTTNEMGITEVDWILGDSTEVQEAEATVKRSNGESIIGSPLVFKTLGVSILGRWEAYEIFVEGLSTYKNAIYQNDEEIPECKGVIGKHKRSIESLLLDFNKDLTYKIDEDNSTSKQSVNWGPGKPCTLNPIEHYSDSEENMGAFDYNSSTKSVKFYLNSKEYIVFKVTKLTATDLWVEFSGVSTGFMDLDMELAEFFAENGSGKFKRK